MAAARMGLRTAIITMNLDLIAQMSCNPAIGAWPRAIWCAKWTLSAASWRSGRCRGHSVPAAQHIPRPAVWSRAPSATSSSTA